MTYLATEGIGCLPVLPQTGADDRNPRSLKPNDQGIRASKPRQERVRHVLYGSLEGIDRTIKILHHLRYADPNDWSDPIPVPPSATEVAGKPNQWMVIMTKTLVME